MHQYLFPRSFKTNYLEADYGDGLYIYDKAGKKYLDGCSGALISNLGHRNKDIIAAVEKQFAKLEFAHPSRWRTDIAEEAAAAVAETAPGDLDNVWFVSGGSEAVETALKLARQYYVERDGEGSGKHVTIGRWNSYHGSTIGTMAVAGSMARRRMFLPLFKESPKIPSTYCYRCHFCKRYPQCGLLCAHALEEMIQIIGPQYISSFIAEPIVGSTAGAVVPPDEYWPMLREICDRYDILLIADEVMTGCGRTGKNFCVDHWNVVPDIIATAKGMAAGYMPTGGIIARNHLIEAIKNGSGAFMHGHTYNGNPMSAAAVAAVFRYMKEHKVVENAAKMGELLGAGLKKIGEGSAIIGEVRGKGLMWGFEVVKDKASKEPFEKKLAAANVVTRACIEEGLIIYPSSGQITGTGGDNFMIGPPLVITEPQVKELLEKLKAGIEKAENAIAK
ncbi:aminotransferase class III-fold pyridoxal phosphate-dependent enzyme [Synergistes jonesii]|uniref:Aminotransferase class III n=1 Tax=Synergistes jonesii TaxID=2754 RepID=A0A073IS92_9BACT|nr:aminotransferase class III-fold pyridoxal phosphate-dependent enzyme [Synergistes jonesii]KEJ92639.1 aminotransferase class III [Synergistes jonesii]OFB63547.1 aminotransferase class III [Synergistes jonesii]OFB63831.1 aminotransferase class III [Synergistes jonesii]OFB64362.1 aminotransferase class III [Synergistes jonesii]OFB67997.1 aminotransferase class III [Synergistes jonesii]